MDKNKRIHVIACGVLAIDIKRIGHELGFDLSSTFLEGGLHSNPKLLKQKLQEAIDTVSTQGGCERIVIGYGLCGNGAVGIAARNVPLVIPRVHDCIALFLGSDQAYKREFAKYPGTYYISAGWYQEKVQPQSQKQCGAFIADKTVTHNELVKGYGEENAAVIKDFVNSWQKNYQRAAFINTSAPGAATYEAHAKEMAKAYGWKYEYMEGDCDLLRKALQATGTTDDILFVPPDPPAIINQLGFYRQQDRPEVYLLYRSGFYCHVQNKDQMIAFGGFGKVQVVSSLNLNGTNTGDCGWPNGYFRRSNQPEVYRMYGGGIPEFNIGDRFCHVANEAQMNAYGGFGQVRVVSPNSDLGRGRTFTGECSNP